MTKKSLKNGTHIERQDAFIAAYIKCLGNVKKACETIGCDRSTAYGWFGKPEFMERLNRAKEEWHDALFSAAYKRAFEKSDFLMVFLLKSLRPEHYDDNIRKAKYLNENGMLDPDQQHQPIKVVLHPGELPERLREPHVNGHAKEE